MSGAFSRTLLRLAMGLPVLAGEGTRVANPPGGVRGASGATRRPPWRPRSPSLRPKPPAPPDTAAQRRTTPPAPIPASAAHRPQTDVSQRSRSRPLSSIRWDRSVKHVPGPDNAKAGFAREDFPFVDQARLRCAPPRRWAGRRAGRAGADTPVRGRRPARALTARRSPMPKNPHVEGVSLGIRTRPISSTPTYKPPGPVPPRTPHGGKIRG